MSIMRSIIPISYIRQRRQINEWYHHSFGNNMVIDILTLNHRTYRGSQFEIFHL